MMLPPIAEVEAAVKALHPGPGPDFAFPDTRRTPAERLADTERRLLEAAIDRFAKNDGEMGHLARSIIVLRAELGTSGGASNG